MTNSSVTSAANLTQFQGLLRELFQFDCADLDFGIYRIMNHKREAVERFISEQLPATIATELGKGPLAQQAQAEARLEEIRQRIMSNVDENAFDDEGELETEYHQLRVGKEYLKAQRQVAEGSRSRDAVEASIYNHLFTFFSRYYEDGDFIAKRRYSRNQRYAIPYNGEEVYLHWANIDQYYVKSDEYFRNYDWEAPNGVKVHFRLNNAAVEQDNVLSARRFFLPCVSKAEWDATGNTMTIPFEYRPLSGSEIVTYKRSNRQEAIVKAAVSAFAEYVADTAHARMALIVDHPRSEDNPASYLEHHLRQYVRRNNSDFFIHKDLSGFLNRELDFYLKNEVLDINTLVTAGQEMTEGWFQQMRLTKAVGSQIIDFLAQIERFQKLLWEKTKFVTDTQYCITMSNIPADFYPDIAANEAQWQEWQELYGLDISDRSQDFLEARPTLMLDTRHFSQNFVDRLLTNFELDMMTDGLLIHGENWQALNLIQEKYKGQITCIHIDPPYNTQTSGFLYKNDYQHSSWLAMMQDRILAVMPMMHESGALISHIDENEYEVLYLLLEKIGIPDGGTIVWDKKNPMLGRQKIATQHEYVLWRTWNESSVYIRPKNIRVILSKAKSILNKHGTVDEECRHEFRTWIKNREGLTGGERAYSQIDSNGRVFQSVAMGAPEPRIDSKFHVPLIHPISLKECPVPSNGWSRTPETLQELIAKDEILFGRDETVQPRKKVYLTAETGRQLSSVINLNSKLNGGWQ